MDLERELEDKREELEDPLKPCDFLIRSFGTPRKATCAIFDLNPGNVLHRLNPQYLVAVRDLHAHSCIKLASSKRVRVFIQSKLA